MEVGKPNPRSKIEELEEMLSPVSWVLLVACLKKRVGAGG